MRKTRIKKNCLVCNNVFGVFPYSLKKGYGKFCGMVCAGASRRGKPNGRNGGKTITLIKQGVTV